MKIPLYFAKPLEELARAVAVAVGTYLVTAVTTNGVPTTQEAIFAVVSGAVPIVWAAIRVWLNQTPLTPPLETTPTPVTPASQP